MGQAITYTLNQWEKLTTYLNHGVVEIDNNLVENAIRPFALGRKNWLFMGNARGANAAAVIYSLLATCKIHSIEPYAYFKFILDCISLCKSQKDYHALLPFNLDRNLLAKAYSTSTWH